jgi:Glycosyl hydrolase family 3 N terminal domain
MLALPIKAISAASFAASSARRPTSTGNSTNRRKESTLVLEILRCTALILLRFWKLHLGRSRPGSQPLQAYLPSIMKIRSSYENHPPIARHPNWIRFLSTSRCLPTLILIAQGRLLAVIRPLGVSLTVAVFGRTSLSTGCSRCALYPQSVEPAVLADPGRENFPGAMALSRIRLRWAMWAFAGRTTARHSAAARRGRARISLAADATALHARMGLGAAFDRRAVLAAGQLVGNEGRALGVDLVYAPQVDLTRLPNWVRNNATYGEDPFLKWLAASETMKSAFERASEVPFEIPVPEASLKTSVPQNQ